jgi:hypothetical protein
MPNVPFTIRIGPNAGVPKGVSTPTVPCSSYPSSPVEIACRTALQVGQVREIDCAKLLSAEGE